MTLLELHILVSIARQKNYDVTELPGKRMKMYKLPITKTVVEPKRIK